MPSFIITSRTSSPNSNWETLTISGLNSFFICEAKVFSVGSTYGINNGRISKLYIKEWCGLCCANYDRGYWDVEPAGVYKNMVDFVVNFYKKNKPLFAIYNLFPLLAYVPRNHPRSRISHPHP